MKAWHVISVCALLVLGMLIVWLVLAYGELPRLWSEHEQKKIRGRDQIISYTTQDIPADPINLKLSGAESAILCAFTRAGWTEAQRLSLRSSVGIVGSVVLQRPYPAAPVSSLYFRDRRQDFAFQKDEGPTARRRHHVRLWRVAPDEWVGAASFDRGVGLNLYTLQVTHHIGPNIDKERDEVGTLLKRSGARYVGSQPSHLTAGKWHRNGGGDRYRTDGRIKAYTLASVPC